MVSQSSFIFAALGFLLVLPFLPIPYFCHGKNDICLEVAIQTVKIL